MADIIVALDGTNIDVLKEIVTKLSGLVLFKCGLEFAEAHGPQGLKALGIPDDKLFLDHKWVDIPNTVSSAFAAALQHYKPAIVNVYAMGASKMMKDAVAVRDKLSPNTKLIAVTVLTSLKPEDIAELIPGAINFFGCELEELPKYYALHLAKMAKNAGFDGVVCSGHEIEAMRTSFGCDFKLAVPGIRPKGSAIGDQARVMTPYDAVKAGADYLVIGRPITCSDNIIVTVENILADMNA